MRLLADAGRRDSIAKHRYEVNYTPNGEAPPEAEPNLLSMSLLKKPACARRNLPEPSRFPRDRRDSSRNALPPRHDLDVKRPSPDDDDEELDDDNLVWVDE